MTSYKSRYGITLKQAKQIAIANNGHLPLPGYETIIDSGMLKITGLKMYDPNYGLHEFKTYLANKAGKFYLWRYVSVNVE